MGWGIWGGKEQRIVKYRKDALPWDVQSGWTDPGSVWDLDSGGPKEACVGVRTSATCRWIPLNCPCATAMRPVVKLLWPLVVLSCNGIAPMWTVNYHKVFGWECNLGSTPDGTDPAVRSPSQRSRTCEKVSWWKDAIHSMSALDDVCWPSVPPEVHITSPCVSILLVIYLILILFRTIGLSMLGVASPLFSFSSIFLSQQFVLQPYLNFSHCRQNDFTSSLQWSWAFCRYQFSLGPFVCPLLCPWYY